MEDFTKQIYILSDDELCVSLNGSWIYCVTAENAEYINSLEDNVLKLQEENKLLKRRLNDMRELHGLYGNH